MPLFKSYKNQNGFAHLLLIAVVIISLLAFGLIINQSKGSVFSGSVANVLAVKPKAKPTPTPTPRPTATPIPTPTPTPPGMPTVCPSGSEATSSGDLVTAIANTPSGGTLCLNGGLYTVSTTINIAKPITIIGLGNPQLNQTIKNTIFNVNASNVTIEGLSMKGFANGNNQSSCSFGSIGIMVNAVNTTNFSYNTFDTFTCGVVLAGSDTFQIYYNHLLRIGYAGMTADPGFNGTVDHNTVDDVGAGLPYLTNAYGLVATGDVPGQESRNITFSNNLVSNAQTWECYDTHNGQSISFINNTCYSPGTVGINVANDYATGVMSPHNITIKDNVIDTKGAPNRDGSIVLYGTRTDSPSGSITTNKLYGFGTSGHITVGPQTTSVTASGNICSTTGTLCTYHLP